jgi:hypothetical protein
MRAPQLRLLYALAALLGLLLAQPKLRKREREMTDIGETVASYMVERDRAATRREWMMIGLAGASCLASVIGLAVALL